MDWSQVADLGGMGVALQVGTRILGMLAADRKMQNDLIDRTNAANLSAWQAVRDAVGGSGGKWTYRVFVAACVFIIVAPLAVPLFWDNVVLHWYVPKEGSWWIWDKSRMIEHVIGPSLAAGEQDGRKHVALLPFMYSFANNCAWFYFAGKPLKHRF